MSQESQWIRTTTTETFKKDVVEQSMTCPVVVDFWAEWCGPCKQLMPLLEKLTTEFDGRFILVKINVDELPDIAGAFGVQSIPFVIAMIDGQPVSQLPGVMPEPQLREWLESFLPSAAVEAYNAGLAQEGAEELDSAEASFRSAVELDGDAPQFRIAHARVLLSLDREQECAEIIEQLETRGFLEPEAEALKDQLALRANVEESGGTATARQALESDPDNTELQIRLAEALCVDKRFDEACDMLLTVIANDRTEVRDKAKEAMVAVLSAMGPKSQHASDYRRRLATAFY
ncbi:MAG: tetratricopeptide repeat protein [Fuerstiella sp.]|nr:tetratricopeptide repeat protein [Fuerstiella sp.]